MLKPLDPLGEAPDRRAQRAIPRRRRAPARDNAVAARRFDELDTAKFWELIDMAQERLERRPDVATTEHVAAWLARRLARLHPESIVAFDRIFCQQFDRADQPRLRQVSALLRGWPSPDGFDYFRAWLIGQGREVFERALHAPDSLADFLVDGAECEDFLYVAMTAYKTVTGTSEIPHPKVPSAFPGAPMASPDEQLSWMVIAASLPRLWARFSNRVWVDGGSHPPDLSFESPRAGNIDA